MKSSVKTVVGALDNYFARKKATTSLPNELRAILQEYVEEQDGKRDGSNGHEAGVDLHALWERWVENDPAALDAFVGVLRELFEIIADVNLLHWWQLVVKPAILGSKYSPTALEDARQYAVHALLRAEQGEGISSEGVRASRRICLDLLQAYTSSYEPLNESAEYGAAADYAQIRQRVEDTLVAFGRKRPTVLFNHIDDMIRQAKTRSQGLSLLSSFTQHDTPHLYLVVNTPLVEDLLKCLMNDTSTTVLTVALKSLITLLPHIPGSLGPHLPRMFLVYSRLLCWEKFSPLSTAADRSLVTDSRVSNSDSAEERDPGDVGIDPTWDKARPVEGAIEASTPALLDYFTFVYGLYPLNFCNYIRKPRRYLKNLEFPGADDFDLDSDVIRKRTDQFRQVHQLHPNFYNMTAEEELIDPKWPKADPSDVVGDCHSLRVNLSPALASPGPPPTGKLPAVPPLPPGGSGVIGNVSPAVSHFSLRSTETQSASSAAAIDGNSPTLKPQVTDNLTSLDQVKKPSETNLAYLQGQITLLKSELNFERWHKAQYSQHIGRIMRRNIKEATAEAETLNLINANRALKKQIERMREAREATIKDSALTRKQANSLEANLTERFNKFKIEQEAFRADTEELRRLRIETGQYRELLVASEARELEKTHELELARRDIEQLELTQSKLKLAQRKLHEYEYREFEFTTAKRQNEILQSEKERLFHRLQNQEHEYLRFRQAYAAKVTELEAQAGLGDAVSRDSSGQSGPDVQAIVQQATYETQAKLNQLKKSYSKLVEKHTDLELEYQTLKGRLDNSTDMGHSFYSPAEDADTLGFDLINDYTPSLVSSSRISTSEPTRRFHAPLQDSSQPLTLSSLGRKNSIASRTSSQAPAAFNQSAPLGQDESMSTFSADSGKEKKEKVQADSTLRVYGRGKCSCTEVFVFSQDVANSAFRRSAEHQAEAQRVTEV